MKVTVFTPIYNRAYIVDELYKSLKKQTVKDFEWLIIDDGSTDNIKEYVETIKKDKNDFDIVFIQKENGGKHTCINMGTEHARGELFFIVDSDDHLSEDAIEKVIKMYSTIEGDNSFCGVAGLRVHNDGKLIGTTFNQEYVDATSLERDKFNINGDKSEVFRTEILKKYKFPVFKGEKFVTENVVWYKLALDGYKIRWFNEPIYYCEYLQDGLSASVSKSEDLVKNFYGDVCARKISIDAKKAGFARRIIYYGKSYSGYKQTKDKEKLDFVKKELNVNNFSLIISYYIFSIYNKIKFLHK